MSRTDFSVRHYVWNRGPDEAVDGALLRRGVSYFFIPNTQLRAVADAIHDYADTHPGTTGTTTPQN